MNVTGPLPSGVASTPPAQPARRIARQLTTFAALTALTGIAGCSHDDGATAARAAFEAFQRALQDHDADACRDLLTVESQQVLTEIDWQDVAAKKPLEVLAARREHPDNPQYLVDVLDPNLSEQPRTPGQFVVVREYGRLVVDLVASAGLTATTVEASSSGGRSQTSEQFEPRKLTPADHERIRKYELSQPPR